MADQDINRVETGQFGQYPDQSTEQGLRRWALEQVISHRSGNGFTLATVIEEANKVIEFVKTGEVKKG